MGHGWLVSYNHSIERRYLFPCILWVIWSPCTTLFCRKNTSDVDPSYQCKNLKPPKWHWDQQHGFVKGKGFSTSTFHGAGWALDRTKIISKLYYLKNDSLGWKLMVGVYDFPFGALNGLCIFRRVTETCSNKITTANQVSEVYCKPSVRSVTSWKTFSKKIPRGMVCFFFVRKILIPQFLNGWWRVETLAGFD